jgi:hypothetical protein
MSNDKRRSFRQPVTVLTEPSTFGQVYIGDCFTVNTTMGFGNIWLGFSVYLKTSDKDAIRIEDGKRCRFNIDDDALRVHYGSIERPEEI